MADVTQRQIQWLTRGGSGQERQLWQARGDGSGRGEAIGWWPWQAARDSGGRHLLGAGKQQAMKADDQI